MLGRIRLNNIMYRKKIKPDILEWKLRHAFDRSKLLGKDFVVYSPRHSSDDSFYEATKFPILLGQFVCLTPLSHKKLQWISLRTYISLMLVIGQIFMAVLSLLWLHHSGISIFKSGTVLFFGGAAVMELLMIRVSFMWPELLTKWTEIEYHFGYHKNLKRIFAFIATMIIVFSTVEHLSNLLYGLFATSQNSSKILKKYSSKMFPQVFERFPYTMWRALPVLYINSISTLIYSFGDQLIIMISLALGNYFELFNRKVFSLRGKILTSIEWKMLRLKYTKLCELTYSVDDCLCHLLCLTFLIHLYIICVEMHQGMLYYSDSNEKVHTVLSFVVSTLRACALCYTTVRVHENSRHILNVLYAVPSASYSKEIELFIQQVLYNETVLSGSHLFSMKRSFLLTIAGTIVSYQILLLQMKDFAHLDNL